MITALSVCLWEISYKPVTKPSLLGFALFLISMMFAFGEDVAIINFLSHFV